MKNFLRIFNYSTGLTGYVPIYILFTILAVLFSAFNLALLIPLLDILFDKVETSVLVAPENRFSIDYGLYLFKSEFIKIIGEGGKSGALVFVCVSIAVSIFMANVFRYMGNIVSARIRTDTLRSLRNHIFDKISGFHIGYFTNERKGDLISRITNDVQEVDNSILGGVATLFKEPLTILVYFVVLFVISFELTLVTLVILPVGGTLLSVIVRLLKKQALLGQQSLGRIVNIFDETISGMRVVKAFNARRKMLARMRVETSFYRRIGFSMALKREMASPFSEFLGVGIVIGILYYGGMLILNGGGGLEASAFISYLAIYSQIIAPAKAFTSGISNLQKGLASSERIFEIIDTESEIQNAPNAIKLDKFTTGIEFKKVSFAYDREPVLTNITFSVPRGSTVALVGPSGAGKSTLADLLPRFYDTSEGDILIDGVSIKQYELESLRSHMGIVTQESILFNDSIKNNIGFGVEKASDEDIINAAKIANVAEYVDKMEEGYETGIGERGARLSGGQRQRLSIARAVLKNPEILILDEATSALDSESERLVQEALTNLMKNRTTLVIAHRLSTIQHADTIIVLDQGKIVEMGTHGELISLNGLYKNLSTMQNVFIDATE